jgi:hypothetical protein
MNRSGIMNERLNLPPAFVAQWPRRSRVGRNPPPQPYPFSLPLPLSRHHAHLPTTAARFRVAASRRCCSSGAPFSPPLPPGNGGTGPRDGGGRRSVRAEGRVVVPRVALDLRPDPMGLADSRSGPHLERIWAR